MWIGKENEECCLKQIQYAGGFEESNMKNKKSWLQ